MKTLAAACAVLCGVLAPAWAGATSTATDTRTRTSTRTFSNTRTITPTRTISPTRTETRTLTTSPTRTDSRTQSATDTPTPTCSATPSTTRTASRTPSATVTPVSVQVYPNPATSLDDVFFSADAKAGTKVEVELWNSAGLLAAVVTMDAAAAGTYAKWPKELVAEAGPGVYVWRLSWIDPLGVPRKQIGKLLIQR